MKVRAALALLCCAAANVGCLAFHEGPLPGKPRVGEFADVDGAHVRFVDRGEGPPVVLVHGFASSLDVWDAVIDELAKEHRVLALDLKGFGWSSRPEGDYSPAAEARLVLGLMTARGIDKAAVVAHSWGSSVALSMALEAPERVTKLALYDAWVYEEQLPTMFVWARAGGVGEALFAAFYDERVEDKIPIGFYDPKYVTQPIVDGAEKALAFPGTKAAALAAVRGQRFAALQERYRQVKQPTLLLWGREDRVTFVTFGERLLRELPDAKMHVYPRCGHFPMVEAAAESTHDLVAFLHVGAEK